MKGFFSVETVTKDRPGSVLSPQCGSCGLYKKCETPKMPHRGNGKRRVLIVGDMPNEDADELDEIFAGDSGDYLKRILQSLGVHLERDTFYTNAIICHPGRVLSPTDKQVGWCRANLLRTLDKTKPDVVVTLGRPALVSVIQDLWLEPVKDLERWIGWKIPLPDFWLIPCNHPSFLLYSRNSLLERQFAESLGEAFSIDETSPPQSDWDSKIEIIYNDRDAASTIKWFDDQGGWVAVDYETNCIKPDYPKARIISCALSNGERTISYPWNGEAIRATWGLLHSDRTRKIAANLKMEERWTLFHSGRGVVNWGWDTMLAAHCLDNRKGICSLKFQSFVKLGVPTYNQHVESLLKSAPGTHYNRIRQIEPRTLLLYGGRDALHEFDLAMIQRQEMGFSG